tara:strand:- start:1569 stop:2216 length:648 start_codon:yes stop_codon:yes gene_type:complete
MIPKLHYISQGNSANEQYANIQKACASGIELVLLNVQNYSDKKLLKLAKQVRETTAHYQTRLILANHYKIAKEIKADGVHLTNLEVCPSIVRKELYSWQIIGASSNNLETCETYISKEVDYIYLSPFESPNLESSIEKFLGLNGYTAILKALKTKTPILAAQGVNIKAVNGILETGISGVAVSSEITQEPNIIKAYNQILNSPSTLEQRYTLKKY